MRGIFQSCQQTQTPHECVGYMHHTASIDTVRIVYRCRLDQIEIITAFEHYYPSGYVVVVVVVGAKILTFSPIVFV